MVKFNVNKSNNYFYIHIIGNVQSTIENEIKHDLTMYLPEIFLRKS